MAAITHIITTCKEGLENPQSAQYKVMKGALQRYGVRGALDSLGISDDMEGFARYELGWVFGMMDSEDVSTVFDAYLNVAFDLDLPIILTWTYRKSSCQVKGTMVGGKMFIELATPSLEEQDLPGMFSGGYGGSLKLLSH